MNIISKFTVGSENGVDLFLALKEKYIKELFDGSVDPVKYNAYLEKELDRRTAINDLNNLSTQLIIVFDDDQSLGYAVMKSTFNQPSVLEGKRAVCLSFFILSKYDIPEVRQSLWQKCLSVTKNHAHWIELFPGSPLVPFFEDIGFTVAEQSESEPFDTPSLVMVRQNI